MMSWKVPLWYWIAMTDQWGKYMCPGIIVTESYMLWTTLNGAQEANICIFEHSGLNLNVTSSDVEIVCRINVSTFSFLGILLQHFIAQKITPKSLRSLFGLWSTKDPWRQASPVKGVVALKIAPAVRRSNSDKIKRFGKKKKGKGQVSHGRGPGQNDKSHDWSTNIQDKVGLWTGAEDTSRSQERAT